MAYVVHLLHLEPGDDWVDALERQEREQELRALELGDEVVDIVRPDWWRIASHTTRVLPGAELRRTRRGLSFVDRASGVALDLEEGEITLSLPYVREESRARELLTIAQRIIEFLEFETERVAIDAQLGAPFLGDDGVVDAAVRLMTTTRLALDRRNVVARRDEPSSSRPRVL